MRVAHITTTFGKYSETFISDTIRCLAERGVENRVLTRSLLAEQSTAGFDVREISTQEPPSGIARRLAALLQRRRSPESVRRRRFGREIRAFGPDIVHAHFGPNGTFIRRGARRAGVPLVVSFHGFDAFARTQSESRRCTYGRLFQDAAAVTVVSRIMRDRLIALGCPAERVHVIHVGVRCSVFRYQDRAPAANIVRLLCVGRHVRKKGFDSAIRSMTALAAKRPGIRFQLDVIGDGSLRPQLEALVGSLDLHDRVRLLPSCRHAEVAAAMQAADLLIVPSRTAPDGDMEGIPTVVMEACASGLPVVATRHSGIPEALPVENHDCLATEGDDDDLVERILAIACDPSRWSEIARRNLEHVQREFSLESETAKLHDLYAQCAARNARSARR